MKLKNQSTIRLFFLHHSVGRNLIEEGKVRHLLSKHNAMNNTSYEFWDHDYNRLGLKDSGGKRLGVSYNIPSDNTNPDGLATLFEQPIHEPPDNAMSQILQYDVIAFKSCYPTSGIRSEEQLNSYKQHYHRIAQVGNQHPEKIFIALTPPPLVPTRTNPTQAMRARAFVNWLKEGELTEKGQNLFVFDFFSLLAEPESAARNANMLKSTYRRWFPFDSHPNKKANVDIAPKFVDFIIVAIQRYKVVGRKR